MLSFLSFELKTKLLMWRYCHYSRVVSNGSNESRAMPFPQESNLRSLAAERMPLHLVYELVLDRRAQPVLKADWRSEARLLDVAPHKVRVLAELFHADRAHGELPAQDEREQVEAFPAAVREPVREVEQPFPRPSEMPVHVEDEAVHVVGRLVAVVEKAELPGRSPVKVLFKARQRFPVLKAELDERGDVLHVVHALAVRAAPDHRELPARDLAQQVVDVAAVALAEDDRRANDHGGVRRVFHEPFAVLPLGKIFCPSVVVEIFDRAALVSPSGREAVDGD